MLRRFTRLCTPTRRLSNKTGVPEHATSDSAAGRFARAEANTRLAEKNEVSCGTIFTDSPLLFDTHKMVTYLRAGGLSQKQSESITEAMVHVSQQANRQHTAQMVSKNEFVSLRSELSILEKADFALLKTDINAIEKRMETSVAEIYTAVERVENRVIKWVIAFAGAIGLAVARFATSGTAGNNNENLKT